MEKELPGDDRSPRAVRVELERLRQLHAQRSLMALGQVIEGLQVATQQAQAGDPGAKRMLGALIDALTDARAAADGLEIARTMPLVRS